MIEFCFHFIKTLISYKVDKGVECFTWNLLEAFLSNSTVTVSLQFKNNFLSRSKISGSEDGTPFGTICQRFHHVDLDLSVT